jgi:outer membrane protein OmpA-like peptidoglycan-associated protein
MLRTLLTCSSAIALVAGWAGSSAPAAAQEVRLCNPVLDRNGDPVLEQGGGVVTHNGTFECPQVAVVEQVQPVEPAAGPEPLPEGGIVYFPFDVAELTPEASSSLEAIMGEIKDRDLQGITVAGHADRSGPPDYNMQLSERRAQNVAAEMIKEGIPARVIQTEAYGEAEPAVPTEDGVKLQENRRAVIDFEWAT